MTADSDAAAEIHHRAMTESSVNATLSLSVCPVCCELLQGEGHASRGLITEC